MPTIEYLAGFLDADGAFGIRRNNGTGYQPVVRAGNCNMEPLIDLKTRFGGTISMPKKRPRCRQLYIWCVASRGARQAAKKLMPHLVIKRRQAEIIANWPDRRFAANRDFAVYDQLAEMKALNWRGE